MPANRCVIVLGFCLLLTPGALASEAVGPKVYRKALPATVLILGEKDGGSGWVVDREKKLVITNYHVIREQKEVQILFPRFKSGKLVAEKIAYRDAPRIKATVLRTDPQHDLALLKLERVPSWAVELRLAQDDPEPGERLHSIGHPAASAALFVYTTGFVRQVYHKRWQATMEDQSVLKLSSRVVEMGSPINPGDSGGPVLNDRGELVAVSQGIRTDSLVLTYAIAASEVREFLSASHRIEIARKPAAARSTSPAGDHRVSAQP